MDSIEAALAGKHGIGGATLPKRQCGVQGPHQSSVKINKSSITSSRKSLLNESTI
jgi:ABC-type molybdate transport system ATPase subunit